MKTTLQINGREMSFSNEELTAIVEEHFKRKEQESKKWLEPPREGKWFEVNPQDIDRELFKNPRENDAEEETRQTILKAFESADQAPNRWLRKFETCFPKKTWRRKSGEKLIELATEMGNHNANWVEQALEWAQRISNGETWAELCRWPDIAKNGRLIINESGQLAVVGGSTDNERPTTLVSISISKCYKFNDVVPLVIRYVE